VDGALAWKNQMGGSASDFVHVVPVDLFLKKQQYIDWVATHPEPKDRHTKFDKLNARLYGDVGIVNGSVIATDENGKELDRTMFTDGRFRIPCGPVASSECTGESGPAAR